MPHIKLEQAIGGHDKGDTITVTKGAAQYLTDQGAATEVRTKPKAEPKANTTTSKTEAKASTETE